MAIRVGINGFGRIGRQVLRAAKQAGRRRPRLRRRQRPHRHQDARAPVQVRLGAPHVSRATSRVGADGITVDGDEIKVFAEKDPAALPWKDLGVDIVLESTGRFTDADEAPRSTSTAARRR